MWILYTPHTGWRPILARDETFYRHWLGKTRNLAWQIRFIPLD
jgi:hypothetical protein